MAIIDKIQLSGTVYTIGNETTTAVTSASTDNEIPTAKAVYDAIPQGGGSSYTAGDGIDINNDVISVTGKVDTSAFTAHTADTVIHVTSDEKAAWNGKQDALVSGTNIKTINNQSILGEGNITIEGGGGGSITIDPSLDASSTNPVANSAITNAIIIDANNRDSITANDYGSFITFYATQVKSISFTKGYSNAYIEGYILLDNSNKKYFFSGNTSSSTTLTDAVTLNLEEKGASITVKDRNVHTIRGLYMQVWYDNTKQKYSYAYNLKIVFNPPLGANKAEFVSKCQHYGINMDNNSIGGGGSSYTAGDGIDITNDVISVTGKVDTSAITTSISSSSTDTQVPSAKAVYDMVGNIETLLSKI